MTLLNDPEWTEWSDREIALQCKVDHKTVGKIRRDLTGEFPSENKKRTYKTKHGAIAKMNTANIGKKATASPEEQSHYNRVTVKNDHPLFAGQSGTITQSPTPEAAMVEQNNGTSQVGESLTVAHHLQLAEGGLVEIHAPNNSKINGRLARIADVHESTVEVWIRDVGTMTMHKHSLKHQQVEPVPMDRSRSWLRYAYASPG